MMQKQFDAYNKYESGVSSYWIEKINKLYPN